ncbi:hypothetical protein [Spirosoma endophyticum]|uniref:Uncharacterized protein n=1 Tax=Spirosoma endophyticum TaxID=662367 RepID=A0A1I1XMX1_9BACT|nr:hypothetical protein [Spirosoma endophyticum]SFE07073.1 hypothetical protein SAMN05216167_11012 [Spirosoma endophyticum]
MKKRLTLTVGFIGLVVLSSFVIDPPNPVVGRWRQQIDGATLRFNFRPDGTYDGFVNGKSYLTGRYYVRQDTIGVTDGKCNPTYFGSYRLQFLNSDSVRFTAILDTCRDRRETVPTLALGRVTTGKP